MLHLNTKGDCNIILWRNTPRICHMATRGGHSTQISSGSPMKHRNGLPLDNSYILFNWNIIQDVKLN